MMRTWLFAITATILSARPMLSQTARHDSTSTRAGVYTRQQAVRGKDVYAGYCRSCHTPQTHTGAVFNATWNRRALSELFAFMVDRMPKNEPGSLSQEEYADVLAYVLQMNRMPAGKRELPADSIAMKKIRIELLRIPTRKDP